MLCLYVFLVINFSVLQWGGLVDVSDSMLHACAANVHRDDRLDYHHDNYCIAITQVCDRQYTQYFIFHILTT